MATYLELYDLLSNSTLKNRIAVGCVKKAQVFLDLSSPTLQQLRWARSAFSNPDAVATVVLKYALAANSTLTSSQIIQASDLDLQTVVDTAAAKLVLLESAAVA